MASYQAAHTEDIITLLSDVGSTENWLQVKNLKNATTLINI